MTELITSEDQDHQQACLLLAGAAQYAGWQLKKKKPGDVRCRRA
jgi:hypothetical protein